MTFEVVVTFASKSADLTIRILAFVSRLGPTILVYNSVVSKGLRLSQPSALVYATQDLPRSTYRLAQSEYTNMSAGALAYIG